MWEDKWLLYALCFTTARDIDFFIVHMHHSLFEAPLLSEIKWMWLPVPCMWKEKAKWHSLGNCFLLVTSKSSDQFGLYAFCATLCSLVRLLLENTLILLACCLWLTVLNIQRNTCLSSQSFWTLSFPLDVTHTKILFSLPL